MSRHPFSVLFGHSPFPPTCSPVDPNPIPVHNPNPPSDRVSRFMRETNITETLDISEPLDRASPDPDGGQQNKNLIESAIQLLAALDSALPISSCDVLSCCLS